MKTPTRISYKKLSEFFPGFDKPENTIVIPATPKRQYGHLEYNELVILAAICKSTKPKTIFEFGRFDGLTTLCFAIGASQALIYTLDLPDKMIPKKYNHYAPQIARQRWQEFYQKQKIFKMPVEILMDSIEFIPQHYNKNLINNVDLIFIDGNHEFKHIVHDSENALQMLAPNGIIIWHDYFKRSFPAVTAYISDLAERNDIYWIEDPFNYLETSLCFYCPEIKDKNK